MAFLSILQDMAIDARHKAQNKLTGVSLNDLKKLPKNKISEFQIISTKILYNKLREAYKNSTEYPPPKVVRMVINYEASSYVVIVGPYLIDCAVDYFVPTKIFAMRTTDYPIKIMDYQTVTDKFVEITQPDLKEIKNEPQQR